MRFAGQIIAIDDFIIIVVFSLINGNHEWVVVLVSSLYSKLQTS